jgi:outer membrane biosynthesis protein TonB
MDRKRGWLSMVLGTVWVGAVLWALTYKVCTNYFTLGLQGSIVIAVGLLLVWLLAFRLLNFMLRTETIRNLKILIMSFICGVVFALYFPMMLEWVNPTAGSEPESEAVAEQPASEPVPAATVTTPTTPPLVTTSPAPISPPPTSPPFVEEKPAPPPKPVVEKKPEPPPTTLESKTDAGETVPKPTEDKPIEQP